MLAQAMSDTATTTTAAGAVIAIILKWLFWDMKRDKAEITSRQVREENLVLQTSLLKKIYRQKRRGNKASKKNHEQTHELLQKLMNNENKK